MLGALLLLSKDWRYEQSVVGYVCNLSILYVCNVMHTVFGLGDFLAPSELL